MICVSLVTVAVITSLIFIDIQGHPVGDDLPVIVSYVVNHTRGPIVPLNVYLVLLPGGTLWGETHDNGLFNVSWDENTTPSMFDITRSVVAWYDWTTDREPSSRRDFDDIAVPLVDHYKRQVTWGRRGEVHVIAMGGLSAQVASSFVDLLGEPHTRVTLLDPWNPLFYTDPSDSARSFYSGKTDTFILELSTSDTPQLPSEKDDGTYNTYINFVVENIPSEMSLMERHTLATKLWLYSWRARFGKPVQAKRRDACRYHCSKELGPRFEWTIGGNYYTDYDSSIDY